jgi:hypothetical protein
MSFLTLRYIVRCSIVAGEDLSRDPLGKQPNQEAEIAGGGKLPRHHTTSGKRPCARQALPHLLCA